MNEEQQEIERQRNEELGDIRHVMATPQGRRFVWRLISAAQIFHEPGPAGADFLNHANGRRGLGLMLYNEVREADIRAFRSMEFENTALLEALLQKVEKDDVSS